MPITYNPADADKNVWPPADYDATLMAVDDSTSRKTGDEMEVWQIGVYHPDGREQTIKEYVTAKAAFKIKGLAIALGKRAEFDAGTFTAEDHIGANFIVTLKTEEDVEYGDKNKIVKFKPKTQAASGNGAPTTIGSAVRQKIAGKPAPNNPVSDEMQFKDSEIPF